MMRIILFGMGVVGVLLVTLGFTIWSGQYEAMQPQPVGRCLGRQPVPECFSECRRRWVASASVEAQLNAAASGGETTVDIANLKFGPDVTVAAGSTVAWKNGDTVPHTATEGPTASRHPMRGSTCNCRSGSREATRSLRRAPTRSPARCTRP